MSRVFAFMELPKITRIRKTLVSDSDSRKQTKDVLRFPDDFTFKLTKRECGRLSQIVITSRKQPSIAQQPHSHLQNFEVPEH
jgi:hypothetical protein